MKVNNQIEEKKDKTSWIIVATDRKTKQKLYLVGNENWSNFSDNAVTFDNRDDAINYVETEELDGYYLDLKGFTNE